ncbi:unnamed protein product [Absidia cylindrospora]
MASRQYGSPFNDHDPYYNGGGYYGHGERINDFSIFMMDHHVRMYWIAFFALLAYWGFLWFLRHVFGDGHQARSGATTAEEEVAAPPQNNTGGYSRWIRRPGTTSTHNRLTRASQVLGDLILMLLSVLVLNTVGQGSTRSIMILTWV